MLQDKLGKVWFFQKTFLLADTNLVLGMPFFTLSSALAEGQLFWRTYTAADTLLVKGSVRKRFASSGTLYPATLYLHHLDAQDKLTNGFIICATQIVVEFDGVDAGGGDGNKSVKKSKKSQKSEKFPKTIGLEERLSKHRSSVKELVLLLELW